MSKRNSSGSQCLEDECHSINPRKRHRKNDSSSGSSSSSGEWLCASNRTPRLLEDASPDIEESPVKRDCTPIAAKRTSSGSTQTISANYLITDSQQTSCSAITRSPMDVIPFQPPQTRTKKTGMDTPIILDSSPEENNEKIRKCLMEQRRSVASPIVSRKIIGSTQDIVTESDDEEYLSSEKFDIDEYSRLQSSNPSDEKKSGYDSGDKSESSDEDDTVTRKSVIKRNLTGLTRNFADYMLSSRSERILAKADKCLTTVTYEVVDTVSAWGFSISWLSPRAIMYSLPFARDPSTVTLALPIEVIVNDPSDPETPMFVNPLIIATGKEVTVTNSTKE